MKITKPQFGLDSEIKSIADLIWTADSYGGTIAFRDKQGRIWKLTRLDLIADDYKDE